MQRLPALVLVFVVVAVTGFLLATRGWPEERPVRVLPPPPNESPEQPSEEVELDPVDAPEDDRSAAEEETESSEETVRVVEEEVDPNARPSGASITLVVEAPDPTGVRATLVKGTGPFMDNAPLEPGDDWLPLDRTGPRTARVTFSDLSTGSWSILVHSEVFGSRWSLAGIREETEEVEVVLRVGDAAVHGTVWDARGRPVQAAEVDLVFDGFKGPDRVVVLTDADGRYRAEGLNAGTGWISVKAPLGSDREDRNMGMEPFALKEGEDRRIDVGSPAGSALVRVRITDAAGGAGWSGGIEAIRMDGDATGASGTVSDDGTCELELSPGEYVLIYWGPDGKHVSPDHLTIEGSGEIDHEIRLPGPAIRGRLVTPEVARGEGWIRRDCKVALRVGPTKRDKIAASSQVSADGHYRFDGVPEGEYYLTVSRPFRAAAVPIQISGTGVIEVDIPVTHQR